MEHSTPVAIIENGTRPNQVTRRMSLGALADPAENLVVATPALLIIGHVIDASSEFAWFEKAGRVRIDASGQ
jgi:uroporphyrin-III C-methyltransferase/precorrin-2 dehydrogenase/sirohydrochlorin ferrochelatase